MALCTITFDLSSRSKDGLPTKMEAQTEQNKPLIGGEAFAAMDEVKVAIEELEQAMNKANAAHAKMVRLLNEIG